MSSPVWSQKRSRFGSLTSQLTVCVRSTITPPKTVAPRGRRAFRLTSNAWYILAGGVRVGRGRVDHIDLSLLVVVQPEHGQRGVVVRIVDRERGVVGQADESIARDNQVPELPQIPGAGNGHARRHLVLEADRVFAHVGPLEVRIGAAVWLGREEIQIVARTNLGILGDIVQVEVAPCPAIGGLGQRAVGLGQHQIGRIVDL